MKYCAPQLQSAGVASMLIQAKDQPGSDNHVPNLPMASLSNLLEAR
jgi:hypothetical protein